MAKQQVNSLQQKFSGARVYNSAAQSMANGAYNYASWDSEAFDTDNYHSTTTNKTRLTAPTSGYYRVYWKTSWPNAGGMVDTWFIINGNTSNRYAGMAMANNASGATVEANGSCTVYLNANDYVEIMPYQTSGGALNLNGVNDSTSYFGIERVGV